MVIKATVLYSGLLLSRYDVTLEVAQHTNDLQARFDLVCIAKEAGHNRSDVINFEEERYGLFQIHSEDSSKYCGIEDASELRSDWRRSVECAYKIYENESTDAWPKFGEYRKNCYPPQMQR